MALKITLFQKKIANGVQTTESGNENEANLYASTQATEVNERDSIYTPFSASFFVNSCMCSVCLLTLIKSMHWLCEQRAWNMISGGTHTCIKWYTLSQYILHISHREQSWMSEWAMSMNTVMCECIWFQFRWQTLCQTQNLHMFDTMYFKCAAASKHLAAFIFILFLVHFLIWFLSLSLVLNLQFHFDFTHRLKCVVRSIHKHG